MATQMSIWLLKKAEGDGYRELMHTLHMFGSFGNPSNRGQKCDSHNAILSDGASRRYF